MHPERTRDVYEQLPAYPKPPLAPLPGPSDLDSLLAELNQPRGSLARLITEGFIGLTGFRSFLRTLPNQIEDLLRTHNMRLPGLFAPVISATLALADDPHAQDPLTRAATLVFGARSLYDDLQSGKLPPDTHRGEPLEMGQYPNLFSTCQIVENRGARVFKSSYLGQITVLVKGRFYVLLIGTPGVDTSVAQLARALADIVNRAQSAPAEDASASPGILTCASHTTQLRAFTRMQRAEVNRHSLEMLRHSFLTLCLDLDDAPASHAESALLCHSTHQENRWFHQSLQLVVFGNARSSAICNFTCYLDGNTMMRGCAEIQRRATECTPAADQSAAQPDLSPATELQWQIPSAALEQARRDLAPILDTQQATFEIAGFGRTLFESRPADAVPAFILALQMTASRLTGAPAQITQFLAMSRYRCMDLTTAMVSTPEVVRFADALAAGTVDRPEARRLMAEAVAAQAETTRQARRFLALPTIQILFLRTQTGIRGQLIRLAFTLRVLLLAALGTFKNSGRDVLVSHPEIYPEVFLAGRPGVRIPYVKNFGLHYQIFPDKTVITLMPGLKWAIPNEKLIAELSSDLARIREIIEEGPAV